MEPSEDLTGGPSPAAVEAKSEDAALAAGCQLQLTDSNGSIEITKAP